VGFNSDVFDVREHEAGEFMIRTLVFHREKILSGILSMSMVLLKMSTKVVSSANCLQFVREVRFPCSLVVILTFSEKLRKKINRVVLISGAPCLTVLLITMALWNLI
jgi:hypothetical protein